jgi:hypothetical protein
MSCGRETTDHGRGSERLRCGVPLYFTDGGPKVVRTEFVRCAACKSQEMTLEETNPHEAD